MSSWKSVLVYVSVAVSIALLVAGLGVGCRSEADADVSPESEDRMLAIVGVGVLAMVPGAGGETSLDETILLNQTVVVRGDRIEAVGPSDEIEVPELAEIVDGKGRFLIPGLADMHVHVDHPSELGIYPAYGVTTVLNLRGLAKHLAWRDEIAGGASLRPTLLTTADYVDGYPPYMQPMMSFDSPEEAAAAVAEQKAAGYDYVKVYSRLSAEQFTAISEAARKAGIAVVGHGSANYSLQELVAGQANVAHGEELIRWYWDPDRPEESLDEIVDTLVEGETAVTANLNFSRSLIRQKEDLEALLGQPEGRFLHPAIFQPFRRENNRYARRDDAWLGRVRTGQELQKRLIKKLVDSGVAVLAGTDASTAGVYPGYSLVEELQEMVSAGLTPWQALRTATRNPGDFVARTRPGAGSRFGRIESGYRADLVLLDKNPLDDIGNVAAVAGIVLRGTWYPRQELRSSLERLAGSFGDLNRAVLELELHLFAGRIEDARRVFDATREKNPGAVLFSQYVPFFVGYGFLYGDDGYNPDSRRLEVALGLYRMYAETYPEFHSAHYMLARAYQANGDPQAAIASVQEALRIHPAYPDARLLLEELQKESTDMEPVDS